MGIPILGDLIKAGLEIIDKLIPDKQAAAQAKIAMLQLQQSSEFKVIDTQLQMAQMQADINKVEAANASVFVSGWRPAIGWICGTALAAAYLGQPALTWVSGIYGWPAPPKMDLGDLMYLLFGMLGIGTMRTVEKIKGVA